MTERFCNSCAFVLLSERCGGGRPGSCGGLQIIGRRHREAVNVGRGSPLESAICFRRRLHAGSLSHPLPEAGHAGRVTHRGLWAPHCLWTALSPVYKTWYKTFQTRASLYLIKSLAWFQTNLAGSTPSSSTDQHFSFVHSVTGLLAAVRHAESMMLLLFVSSKVDNNTLGNYNILYF